MSSMTALAPRVLDVPAVEPVAAAVAVPVEAAVVVPVVEPAEGDVLGLDRVATLGFVVERRRRLDAAAAEELRAVTHWADLHHVGPEALGAVDPEVGVAVERRAQVLGLPGLLGMEGELRLAGQGAFRVEEFAVAELATALGLSEPAGRAYVGQAVELRDRLPLCWARVMTGELPAWKGRQIAEQTIPLTADAAGWVDAHLAPFAHKLSLGRVLRAVEAAVLRFDPAEAARRAEAAAEKRGVWCEEHLDGTTRISAITDTPDAVAFDTALSAVATSLGALGDPDPLQVRRARAVGALADPQYALSLTTAASDDPADAHPADAHPADAHPADARARGAGLAGGPVVHVHLHLDAVTGVVQADGGAAVARVTGTAAPGARPIQVIERWLAGLRPDAVVKVTPVVDLTAHHSVDAYEVPHRLTEQVEHPGGRPPPGQTRTSNLTKLCRFHHRLKTHGGWDYQLTYDTVFTWTSPLGRRYTVDETGTRPLP